MPNLADLLFRAVDGVFAVDAKQRITYWNSACEQLLGIPRKQALGKPCSEIVRGKDPAGQPFCGGGCCASLAQGWDGPKIFPLRARDGEGNELRLSVSIVLVPSRRENCWTCVHLLHRGDAVDMLEILEYQIPQKQHAMKHMNDDKGVTVGDPSSPLTPREQEILELLAEGLRVSTMAQLLNVSPVTIRNHVQHIETKLGVHSQVETVAYAYRHNLV
jgi:DNA-binding CsgD family transcriptional regulator